MWKREVGAQSAGTIPRTKSRFFSQNNSPRNFLQSTKATILETIFLCSYCPTPRPSPAEFSCKFSVGPNSSGLQVPQSFSQRLRGLRIAGYLQGFHNLLE